MGCGVVRDRHPLALIKGQNGQREFGASLANVDLGALSLSIRRFVRCLLTIANKTTAPMVITKRNGIRTVDDMT